MDAAGNYIKELQDQLSQLKGKKDYFEAKLGEKTLLKQKGEIAKVVVKIKERECVIIIISSIRGPRQFWRVINEVEIHGLDVDMFQFSSSECFVYLYFHANFRAFVKQVGIAQLHNSLKTRLLVAY